MNYLNKMIVLTAMFSVLSVSGAMAQGGKKDPTAAPGVNKRIVRQKARIEHKLEKGKITQDEANKLNQNVDAVKAKEQQLATDGKLSKEDRKELHKELNENSKEIKNTGVKTPAVPATPTGH